MYGNPESIAGQAAPLRQQMEYAQQNQAKDMTPITRAVERHGKSLSTLLNRLEELFSRLNPVLSPSAPRPTQGTEPNKPISQSQFADALHQTSDHIDGWTSRTEDILNRLEL